MEGNAFVTGADRGLGYALCVALLQRGWQVFAGQYMPDWPDLAALAGAHPADLHVVSLDIAVAASARSAAEAVAARADRIDLLINNAGVISPSADRTIREAPDYAEMHRLYDVNALGALRVVEAFLPLTDRSAMKRLCFVSSEAGSIARCRRTSWYGYCMSKAALNMAVKVLFNHLRPEGYTFRLYHPGWMRTYMGGEKNDQADMEPEEAAAKAIPIFLGEQEDKDSLVLVDHEGQIWPW
ncbi:MAG: SDR family oxidoreductase [Anaerolineae bacterium]|nr:SDR family oxidoreductase [Anaerolineae bacterium]